jgi:SAM-dependent methyltransferase
MQGQVERSGPRDSEAEMPDPRARARELARDAIARGDATGWFEQLYLESERDGFAISWVDLGPNPYLVAWLDRRPRPVRGRALVVGCGYGDDAELLAGAGMAVVAFDVAPSAVARCRRRFPGSSVEYAVADALQPPAEWSGAFDFIFEAYTIQVLQGQARRECAGSIGRMVAPGGRLLVVARGRGEEDPVGSMPWPLTRAELDSFVVPGLELDSLDEVLEPGDPPVRRFVAEFAARR